jgi:hypothetical protein
MPGTWRISQVVGMRLARHVLKNQDKLVAGITSVTHVEDDVKVRLQLQESPFAAQFDHLSTSERMADIHKNT